LEKFVRADACKPISKFHFWQVLLYTRILCYLLKGGQFSMELRVLSEPRNSHNVCMGFREDIYEYFYAAIS